MKKLLLVLFLVLPLPAVAQIFQGEVTIAIRADKFDTAARGSVLKRFGVLFPAHGLSDSYHGIKTGSIIGPWVKYVDEDNILWLVNNFKAKDAYKIRYTRQRNAQGNLTNTIIHGVTNITPDLIAQIKGNINSSWIKITDPNDYKGSGEAQLKAWGLNELSLPPTID